MFVTACNVLGASRRRCTPFAGVGGDFLNVPWERYMVGHANIFFKGNTKETHMQMGLSPSCDELQ